MSNSINDLNAIYSSQIQEAPTGVGLSKTKVGADTITPKDASAVGQHVRAIKYEARKSGEPLPVAYNEYVSKNNLTATQRRIARQKLGLAEETSMPHVSKNDKKAIKTRYKGLFKKDLKGNVAGVNENLSNWREDFELREVEMPSTGVTKKKRPKTSDKSREEITDKDVNNKVIINPTMGELINSFEIELEKIGGTLVEMVEIKEVMVDQLPVSPGELIIQKRMAMLNMRLARKNREKVNKVKRGGAGVKDQITAQPPEKVKVQKPGAQTEDLDKYDRYKRMIRHKQDKYGKNIIGADYNLENERKAKGKKVKEETINEVSPSLMKAGQDAFDRDYRLPDGRVKPLRGRVKAKKEADKKKESDKKEVTSEAAKDQSSKQLDRGMKTTQKAMGVIDNSPYGELSGDKVDRMNKRLRDRRKDISGEKTSKLTKLLKKEDKAFDNVVSMLRKSHGASGVLTKDSPKSKAQPQPKKKPEKDTRSSAQREVDAQYGRTPWNKKGSLGT